MNLLKILRKRCLEKFPFNLLLPMDNEGFQELIDTDGTIIGIISGKPCQHLVWNKNELEEYLKKEKEIGKMILRYLKSKKVPPPEIIEWQSKLSSLRKFLIEKEIHNSIVDALKQKNVELCTTLYETLVKDDPKYQIIKDLFLEKKDNLKAANYYFQNKELFKVILCNYPEYIIKFDFSKLEALVENIAEEIKDEYPVSAALLFGTCKKFDVCLDLLEKYEYPLFSAFSSKPQKFKKEFLQSVPESKVYLRVKLRKQIRYFDNISNSEFPYLLSYLDEEKIVDYLKKGGEVSPREIDTILTKLNIKKINKIKSKSAKKIILYSKLKKNPSLLKLRKAKKIFSLEERLDMWDGKYTSGRILRLDYPYLYYSATKPNIKYRIAKKIINLYKDKTLEEIIDYVISLPKVDPYQMKLQIGYLVSAYANKYGKATITFSCEGLGYNLKKNKTLVIKGDVEHKIIAPKAKVRIECGNVNAPILAREVEIVSDKKTYVTKRILYQKRLYHSPSVKLLIQPGKLNFFSAKLKSFKL